MAFAYRHSAKAIKFTCSIVRQYWIKYILIGIFMQFPV